MEKQIKIYKAYNTELVESVECIMDSETTDYVLTLRNRSLRVKINNSQDLRERLKEAEDKVKQLGQELQPLKYEVQRIFNQALQTTNGISASDSAFAPIKKIFNKLPPTIEEINNELNIAQAKMFCMGNNIDGENVSFKRLQLNMSLTNKK